MLNVDKQSLEKANTILKLRSRGEFTRPEVIFFALLPVGGYVPG